MEKIADVKPKNTWRKPTFRAKVRALGVGDFIVIPTELQDRNSSYYNAKATCPEWVFSVKKQPDGAFHLIRVS